MRDRKRTNLAAERSRWALRKLIYLLRTRGLMRQAAARGELSFALNFVITNASNGRMKRATCAIIKRGETNYVKHGQTLTEALDAAGNVSQVDRKFAEGFPSLLEGTDGEVIAAIDVRTCLRSPAKALSRLTAGFWSDYLDHRSCPAFEQLGLVIFRANDSAGKRCARSIRSTAAAMKSAGGPYNDLWVEFTSR